MGPGRLLPPDLGAPIRGRRSLRRGRNARTDEDLLKVWLKSHRDGSPHTVRVYERIGGRFLSTLAAAGAGLRTATVEHVLQAVEAMRDKEDGSPVKPATVNTYVASVKSFLGFAHRVGFTRFNAGPLIKLKKAPRQVAQRILGGLKVRKLIDAANAGRDRLMLEVAYFGGLRVSELVSLTRRSSRSSARETRCARC